MEYELVKDPWSMQNTIERPYLRRERLETENEAAFPLKGPMPRYVSFASPNPNKWGHPRSYRIQVTSFAGEHLPPSNPMERSISWGRWVPGLGRGSPPGSPPTLPLRPQLVPPPSEPVPGCREGLNSKLACVLALKIP